MPTRPRTTDHPAEASAVPALPAPPHLAHLELAELEADDFDAFHRATQRGFQEEVPAEAVEMDRALFRPGMFYGYRSGSRWVSTFGAFARRLTVPGGAAVPAAAVTAVTVFAPYRRRGLLTAMMAKQVDDARRRGDVVAALYASEAVIYGRFGFGQAAPRARLAGRTRSMRFRPGVGTGGGSVDEVERDDYLAQVQGLHDRLLPGRPGSLDRPALWWPIALYDLEFSRQGATSRRYLLCYDDAGRVDGHATYRIKGGDGVTGPSNEVQVGEVEATGPQAYARLWRYLFDLDLARTFLRRNAPVDDPVRHLVADPRAIHTEVTDGLYVRLLDVPAALAARRYGAEAELVMEVADAQVPGNAGRFALAVGPVGASVRRVRRRPDISLDVRELGAAYLGGTSLGALHRAGLVTEHRQGAVAAASAAFGWPVAPHCADMF